MEEIKTLSQMYDFVCQKGPTYKQHAAAIKNIAQQCSSAMEFGVHEMISGFGLLYGLAQSSHSRRSYFGIDINYPSEDILHKAKKWAEEFVIDFTFKQADVLDFKKIDPVDLLHLDTSHTYLHLTYELETFSSFARSFIFIHDTGLPYGYQDSIPPKPEYLDLRYPSHINREKRGLCAAIEDFLRASPEWALYERGMDSPGYTILRRVN